MIARKDMQKLDLDKKLLEYNLVEALAKNTEYRNALNDIKNYLSDFSSNEIALIDLLSNIESTLERTL